VRRFTFDRFDAAQALLASRWAGHRAPSSMTPAVRVGGPHGAGDATTAQTGHVSVAARYLAPSQNVVAEPLEAARHVTDPQVPVLDSDTHLSITTEEVDPSDLRHESGLARRRGIRPISALCAPVGAFASLQGAFRGEAR
jgi:hypothetical protein